MKLSKLFTKTNKSAKEMVSKNATLLTKAGFIDQTMAGVYTFLPLGIRVLSKIEKIVREEMDTIGQEVFMPSIVPSLLWETTGRLATVDVLMKTQGANDASRAKNDAEYILCCTHEDVVTPLVQKFASSYKDFPVAVYQIQTKFRNEPRAKSGLMRCREFRMKDLYSFHTSPEDLAQFYEIAKKAYIRVYERLGLGKDTLIVLASGGDFTKDFSHEFQTRCEAGEDTVFRVPSSGLAFNREIAPSKAPKLESTEKEMERKDILGEGIVGVSELAKFLGIPVEKTTKTMIYETDTGSVIAAAVRGGYDINEEKLIKAAGVKSITLARAEVVKRVTGADVGYAGIIGLPKEVQVFIDESVGGRTNFECGANKTNYHSIHINFGRDIPVPETFYDIKIARDGDFYPETGEQYEVFQAAEVGNIFPLNTKFTRAFGYEYIDEKGEHKPIYMGSYGIGTSRIMGVIAEKYSDDKGLIWPFSIAPYQVHLVSIGDIQTIAEDAYTYLTDHGVEVLWDDRQTSAGMKLTDADLIGIPIRLVVSPKTNGKFEMKRRTEQETTLVSLDDVLSTLKNLTSSM